MSQAPPAGPSAETPSPPQAAPRTPRPATGFGLADLALLFQVSLWAANYTIVKSALQTVQPLAFNGVRMTVATLIFVGIAWWQRDSLRLPRADLGRMVVLGLLGHTIFQACFALGLARTTAGNAALILALSPVIVAVLAGARGEDRLYLPAWLGMAASFGGAIVLVLAAGGQVGFRAEAIVGDIVILVASIAWAYYTVLSRPMLRRYSALQLNTLTLLLGAPPLLLIGIPEIVAQDWLALSVADWGAFAYATLLAIVVAYFIYSWGVQQIGPSRTAAYYNVTPPLSALIAWWFGGEPLTLTYLAGAVLILAGLYLVRRGTRAV